MSWPVVKLGELFKITSGGTPSRKKPEYYENGNIHWIKTGNLHQKYIETATEFITEDALKSSSTKLFPPDTVLVAMYGATIGACAILSIEACTNQACAAFTPNEQVDPLFLYYLLKSNKSNFVNAGAGGAQPNISGKFLKNFEVQLPPLSVQKQIAAVLEKADTLRGQCQQMEQELNSLSQSVFVDMFGDPVTNPKGWEFKPLARLLKIPLQNGAYYEKDKYTSEGIEMAHMGDTFKGIIKRGNIKRVAAPLKDIEKYAITDQVILVSRRSLVYEGAAKPCLIPSSSEPLIYESSMIRVCPNQDFILPEYLFHYLSNQRARNLYLFKYVTKSTISGINQTNLAKVEIMVPSIELQRKFLKNLKSQDKLLIVIAQANSDREQLFNAIMQRAFKDELNFKDVA